MASNASGLRRFGSVLQRGGNRKPFHSPAPRSPGPGFAATAACLRSSSSSSPWCASQSFTAGASLALLCWVMLGPCLRKFALSMKVVKSAKVTWTSTL